MYFEVLPEIGGERYGNYLKNCKNDVLQERNGHFEILSLVSFRFMSFCVDQI